MGTLATLSYSVDVSGTSPVLMQPVVAGVPIPADILNAYGVFVTSDVTTVASPVVRTISLALVPTASASAVASLADVGDSGHPLAAVAVTAPGLDYVMPPEVQFVGGDAIPPSAPNILRNAKAKAFLNLQGATIVSGGTGFSGGTVATVIGGMPPSQVGPDGNFTVESCVQGVRILQGGKRYSLSTQIIFDGGLDDADPTARIAKAVPTIVGGVIVGVTVIDPGQGYIRRPNVYAYDPSTADTRAGISTSIQSGIGPENVRGVLPRKGDEDPSTARLTPQMGAGTPATVTLTIILGVITAVTVATNGSGYVQPPKIVITDTTGGGAVILPRMGVGSIQLIDPGKGYTSAPTVVLVPWFKQGFPDTSDQRAPFWKLMQQAIQNATATPVVSAAPVIT